MKVEINFLHHVEWSMYGTLQSLILVTILLIGNRNLSIMDLPMLVLVSVIGMMNFADPPIARLIFISFLCLIIYPRDQTDFVKNGLLTLLGGVILFLMYPYKSWISKHILDTIPYKIFFYISVPLWMLWCVYLVLLKLNWVPENIKQFLKI